ncbi:tyrosine-type recombinase/integrase [Zavarzinella formosa]|uniref:tyrosine-type recombinase/integrase n=1 Tax=Zavarzinella formosa TaxID=360055 RepID=UPI0002E461BE|nr:tyrosine-type recombinase/integrase [Zavarzinella formosa]
MAHLYKPKYSRPIPSGAVIVTIKGIRHAKWTGRQKRKFVAPLCESDPSKCLVKVDCWWIEYEDHLGKRKRIKASLSRTSSEQMKLDIERRIRQVRSGDLSEGVHLRAGKLLTDLVEEWANSRLDEDMLRVTVVLTKNRVLAVIAELKASKFVDLTPKNVNRVLKIFREREDDPISAQTSNHYLKAVRTFTKWCVDQTYFEADPMRGAKILDVTGRTTFERRALSPEETVKLITTAGTLKLNCCPISPPNRVALYLVALYTGFRVQECASLTRSSFHLDDKSPWVYLAPEAAKNGKEAKQPIASGVAAMLRPWLASQPARGPLWPADYLHHVAAKMLRRDLKAAKIEIETDDGLIDFHALRTTFGTSLARAGVPIQHAQRLMRHSTPELTMKYYTKFQTHDLSSQVERLPDIFG